jgi:hypothetical protein
MVNWPAARLTAGQLVGGPFAHGQLAGGRFARGSNGPPSFRDCSHTGQLAGSPLTHRSSGQLPVHWSSGRLPVRPFTHGQLAAGPSANWPTDRPFANWPTDRPFAHWPTGWWPVRPRGCWPVVYPPTCKLVGGPFAPTGQWPAGPLAGGPFAHGRLASGLSTHWPTGRLPVRPGECCPVAWPPTGQLADGLFTCPLPTGQLAGGPFTHGQLAGGPFTRVK